MAKSIDNERGDRIVQGAYMNEALAAVQKCLKIARDLEKHGGHWTPTEAQREKLSTIEGQLADLILEIVPA